LGARSRRRMELSCLAQRQLDFDTELEQRLARTELDGLRRR